MTRRLRNGTVTMQYGERDNSLIRLVPAMVWDVVYPSDTRNPHGRYVLYECLLAPTRQRVLAPMMFTVAGPANGGEEILQAACKSKTFSGGIPNAVNTDLNDMQGTWVGILFGLGERTWPLIIGCMPPPYSLWGTDTAQGPRSIKRYNFVEQEITKNGDVVTRLLEPKKLASPLDLPGNDSPTGVIDEDTATTAPRRREREWNIYASAEDDPEGSLIHFHKQHFGVKFANGVKSWLNQFGVFRNRIYLGGANSTTCNEQNVLGNTLMSAIDELLTTLNTLIQVIGTHTHPVTGLVTTSSVEMTTAASAAVVALTALRGVYFSATATTTNILSILVRLRRGT